MFIFVIISKYLSILKLNTSQSLEMVRRWWNSQVWVINYKKKKNSVYCRGLNKASYWYTWSRIYIWLLEKLASIFYTVTKLAHLLVYYYSKDISIRYIRYSTSWTILVIFIEEIRQGSLSPLCMMKLWINEGIHCAVILWIPIVVYKINIYCYFEKKRIIIWIDEYHDYTQ